MSLNTADQRSVDKRNKGLKLRSLKSLEGLRKIMDDEVARGYLAELVSDGKFFYRDPATAADDLLYNAGRRNTSMKIVEDVMALDFHDPKKLRLQALLAATFAPLRTDDPKDEKTNGTGTDTDE